MKCAHDIEKCRCFKHIVELSCGFYDHVGCILIVYEFVVLDAYFSATHAFDMAFCCNKTRVSNTIANIGISTW